MRQSQGLHIRTRYAIGYVVFHTRGTWVGVCRSSPRESDQCEADGGRGGIPPIGHTELAEHVRDVPFDRARTEEEPLRDLQIGHPLAQQGQHLPLPQRQSQRGGFVACGGRRRGSDRRVAMLHTRTASSSDSARPAASAAS